MKPLQLFVKYPFKILTSFFTYPLKSSFSKWSFNSKFNYWFNIRVHFAILRIHYKINIYKNCYQIHIISFSFIIFLPLPHVFKWSLELKLKEWFKYYNTIHKSKDFFSNHRVLVQLNHGGFLFIYLKIKFSVNFSLVDGIFVDSIFVIRLFEWFLHNNWVQ
jgi:hypothetical protein